jgi:pilus assembly protein CpaC
MTSHQEERPMPDQPPRHAHARFGSSAWPCLLAAGVFVHASPGAAAASQSLDVFAGAQHELLIAKGIERLAIGDEAIANITITRQDRSQPAARLLVTGKAPGSTTLMIWENGSSVARTYVVNVHRRNATMDGALKGLPQHAQAQMAALSTQAREAPLADRSFVDVKSHTVQVEVRVVEFRRSVLKEAGFNFSSYGPNSHGFSFSSATPSGTLGDAFRLALGFNKASLNLTLNLMEGNGMARVLAEPTLVAMSGQSASFLAGGELPVPVPQGLGATAIQYKPFGIGLTVTPTVLDNERIALKVAPEASDLDYANALSIGGIAVPAITTRRADTMVELGDGESFIIGGLVSRSTTSNAAKVPWLGDLPVLGNFFKQNNYQMNEKELVIVVTPHLVKPLARGTDLASQLPGSAEQRDGPVWQSIFLGSAAASPVPGFSR